jgi:rhodanese-related sulfurtransferase
MSIGYRNVGVLEGGVEGWKKAGYKILNLEDLP